MSSTWCKAASTSILVSHQQHRVVQLTISPTGFSQVWILMTQTGLHYQTEATLNATELYLYNVRLVSGPAVHCYFTGLGRDGIGQFCAAYSIAFRFSQHNSLCIATTIPIATLYCVFKMLLGKFKVRFWFSTRKWWNPMYMYLDHCSLLLMFLVDHTVRSKLSRKICRDCKYCFYWHCIMNRQWQRYSSRRAPQSVHRNEKLAILKDRVNKNEKRTRWEENISLIP